MDDDKLGGGEEKFVWWNVGDIDENGQQLENKNLPKNETRNF